ncbi:hypothetical protein [Ferrimonas sp.]|uniref:hypothetical protein n=1 Tax=Ferrimonas sp. TaxID=2080861 RepID=UPI003A8F0B00
MKWIPLVLLLLLGGCASTAPEGGQLQAPSAPKAMLTWPEDGRVLLWLQGQLPSELFRAQKMTVELGPLPDAPAWYSAFVAEQRLAELEDALRSMGFQGRVEGSYLPSAKPDQVRLGASYAY